MSVSKAKAYTLLLLQNGGNRTTKILIDCSCQIKSISILAVFAEACNEFAESISGSLPRRATQLLRKKMSQRWRAVRSSVVHLTVLRIEPQTPCSRDARVTARLTG